MEAKTPMLLETRITDTPLERLLSVLRARRSTGKLVLLYKHQWAMLRLRSGHIVDAAAMDRSTGAQVCDGALAVSTVGAWSNAVFHFLPSAASESAPHLHTCGAHSGVLSSLPQFQVRPLLRRETDLPPHTLLKLISYDTDRCEAITLNRDEWQIVAHLVNAMTVEQVANVTGYEQAHVRGLIARLLTVGLVEIVPQNSKQAALPGDAVPGGAVLATLADRRSSAARQTMPPYKVIITGSFGVGKSAFVRCAGADTAVGVDVPVSDPHEWRIKRTTTVSFDFGVVPFRSCRTLHVYGTPGQPRFDFMREALADGCTGFVVLVDSTRPQHLEETAQLIERFVATTNAPFVVAANKQDLPHARSPEYIQQQLNLPSSAPVLPCVANDPRSVRAVLLTLLNQIEATTHSLPEHISAEPRAFTVGVGDVMPVYL
jgi:hypothetical protein